jgi:hypothetical protein
MGVELDIYRVIIFSFLSRKPKVRVSQETGSTSLAVFLGLY